MSQIETEDMDLAEHLKKKIIDFFKYKSNQSILSEILAYMTYKATKIKLFKFTLSVTTPTLQQTNGYLS